MAFHEQSVMDYLSNRRDFVPAADLAEALNVSARTVERAVKHINASNPGAAPILSRRGRGYRVSDSYAAPSADPFALPVDAVVASSWRDGSGSGNSNGNGSSNRGNSSSRSSNSTNGSSGDTAGRERMGGLTSVERRSEVLKTLLMTAPQHHRVTDLWGRYFISDSAIAMDVRKLRDMLAGYDCTVERSGDMVWAAGPESGIRKAICDLLSSSDVVKTGRFLKTDQLVQRRDAAFVQRQLEHIEQLTGANITYPYSVNLFTHLYILIERYREVGVLPAENIPAEARADLERHPGWLAVCRSIIHNVNVYLDTSLPEIETYYLYQYLSSSRIDTALPQSQSQEMPQLVGEVTHCLIAEVLAAPRYRDIDGDELFVSLAKHMKPLINRLQNKIRVNNNLLGQIILEYPDLFQTVKEAVARTAERFGLPQVDDEEVGFIAVYFANAFDTVRPKVNMLLVCTTGMGTAQLLQGKIERRFSEFNIVSTVASKDLRNVLAQHPEVDLVVSTVALPHDIKAPVLVVSAMLTIEDQQRLERQADTIRSERLARDAGGEQ